MIPERWQQIERLYQSALARKPAERAAFLNEACAGDEALRKEVESLLAHQPQAESFIQTPALEEADKAMFENHGQSLVGRQLGPYKILSPLGAGGMGEVYKAHDSRLDRIDALKILPLEFSSDRDRMQRFVREARAASALNHANVAHIYEIGQSDGLHFIAMEYVEGQSLAQKMSGQPLELKEVLEIGIQAADALEEAHRKGITHRDIKSANLMITPKGQVKVLDFGLAKISRPEGEAAGSDVSTSIQTAEGVVMGTLRYMSPEQVLGKELDARTDLFSLGVVLYEMTTGRLPFSGSHASEVTDRILHAQPEALARFNYEVPAELERIIRKCLEKDRQRRYQSARELLIDLKNLKRDSDSGKAAEIVPRRERWGGRREKVFLAVGGVIVLTVIWYLLLRSGTETRKAQPSREQATFTQLTDQPGQELFPSLSPDGKSFVYAGKLSGNWDIYAQRVGGKNLINLTKDSPDDDAQPAFSPDGERIAFRSEREGGGIFVMGATGESVKRLTDFGYSPDWSPDGKEIVCATVNIVWPEARTGRSQLFSVNVSSGDKRLITQKIEDAAQPHWSFQGHRIAYWANPGGQRDIWTIPAKGGEPVPATNDTYMDWNPIWSPDGNYLYFSSDRGGSMNLWRVPLDEKSGKVLGPPEPVTTPSPYSAHISFSRDGRRIAYVQQVRAQNLYKVGFDPSRGIVMGQPIAVTQGSRDITATGLSPDGGWLAFMSWGKQEDIFIIRTDGTGLRQLTDDVYKDRGPHWSPDGKRIAFYSNRSGEYQIWTINPDGSGLQQLTYASSGGGSLPVWSPDGSRLVFSSLSGNPLIMEAGKPWKEQQLQALASLDEPNTLFKVWSWSPDGRKLGGFLRSVDGSSLGIAIYFLESQKFQRLTRFGTVPRWLSDSRRLLFIHQGKIQLVDSQSKKVHDVLSVSPHEVVVCVVPRGDRMLYFSLVVTETDIWLMSLE